VNVTFAKAGKPGARSVAYAEQDAETLLTCSFTDNAVK